ncbi:AAA family ATPase [uncultured Legionella sp.]|uniref:AAA family ATPase n=1 Tax=uncultured Legionella sp. TaxID=210934 RepID=UPI002604EA78|nr:AAA family ATPase [uncultured Legionella sp.]
MTIQKTNYFLFTGGPGAGKTTVLDELERQGHLVVAEVARAIIRRQNATGGNATHNGDRVTYTDLMLHDSINDFNRMLSVEDTVFFDRGIPDLYSYTNRFCGGVTSDVLKQASQYRYNPVAFVFPPWQEIYCHDTERKQDFQEAIETYHAVKEGYQACGYQVIDVPQGTVQDRIIFILNVTKSGDFTII